MRFVENQRLITARLSKCWNQQDAAIACKVGKRSYCRWESGECDPSLASLRLLMDGFGLQADDLGYAHLVTYPLPQDQQGETSTESESDEQEQGRPQSSLILTLTRE